MNPLLEKYNTPYESVPFDQVAPDHFIPAFEKAFSKGRKEIKSIVENTEKPNFENTIASLDSAGNLLNELASILFNLNHAETNEEIQNLTRKLAPLRMKLS